MAEALAIVTDSMTAAVVFALSNLAILSGPSLLTRACPVEAMSVVANTTGALD